MSNMDVADRLLATLRIRAPGVTAQALNLELFNTIDEFFRQSSAWRYDSVVTLDAGTQQYPIFPPAGSDLVQVMAAVYKGSAVPTTEASSGGVVRQRGRIVGTATAPDFDAEFTPDTTVTTGGVFSYSVFFPTYVEIDIPPSEEAAQFPLTVTMALTLNADNLDSDPSEWPIDGWMWSAFHEAWMDGTLGRLFSQIAKPYTNPAAAQYHTKRFRKFAGRAKQVAARGYTYNTPNWSFPRWA